MIAAKAVVFFVVFAIVISLLVDETVAVQHRCARKPRRGIQHGSKKSGDGGYQIYIGNEPNGYQPGRIYNRESLQMK